MHIRADVEQLDDGWYPVVRAYRSEFSPHTPCECMCQARRVASDVVKTCSRLTYQQRNVLTFLIMWEAGEHIVEPGKCRCPKEVF